MWIQNPSQHSHTNQSEMKHTFECSMSSMSFICIINLSLTILCRWERGCSLQQSKWETMLALWLVLMEMQTHRWIWELSESKPAELDDKWRCEVRRGRQVSNMTRVSKKTGIEPGLWRKIINSILYVLSLRRLWHIHEKSHTENGAFNSRT